MEQAAHTSNLPPNVHKLERDITGKFQENKRTQMNSKSKQSMKFDQENAAPKPRPQSAIPRPKGEYMKSTVNTELKRDTVNTHKAKNAVVEAQKKFENEHTFKPHINDYSVPASKEISKEERWKKLTQPKTVDI